MASATLGKLIPVDARTVWTTEAEFTAWLAHNIGDLGEALGLEIELVEQEVPVGTFRVDLTGKVVGSGDEVVIENQLDPTDHSHLGQLLTYAAGREARTIVWISPQFREEHRQAIDWLNLHTDEGFSFFGVELEVWKIGDSPSAPHFNLKAQPSEWQKEVGTRGERRLSERQLAYHKFFEELVNALYARSPGFTTTKRVGYDSWIHFGAGRSGFAFSVAFVSGGLFRVELEIDTGSYEKNRRAYEQLHQAKDGLEQALGEPLVWEDPIEFEHRRACRIYMHVQGSIDSPTPAPEHLREWAIERLLRFRQVLTPELKRLALDTPSKDHP